MSHGSTSGQAMSLGSGMGWEGTWKCELILWAAVLLAGKCWTWAVRGDSEAGV